MSKSSSELGNFMLSPSFTLTAHYFLPVSYSHIIYHKLVQILLIMWPAWLFKTLVRTVIVYIFILEFWALME